MEGAGNFHSLVAVDAGGRTVRFKAFKDKVCIVVNLESMDDFVMKSLRSLANFKDQDRGNYEILIFPSREHLPVEYQRIGAISKVVSAYSHSLRLFTYTKVDGNRIHPLYLFLSDNSPCWFKPGLRSNFTKFVIDRAGCVVYRYDPSEEMSHHDNILRKYSQRRQDGDESKTEPHQRSPQSPTYRLESDIF